MKKNPHLYIDSYSISSGIDDHPSFLLKRIYLLGHHGLKKTTKILQIFCTAINLSLTLLQHACDPKSPVAPFSALCVINYRSESNPDQELQGGSSR